MSPVQSTSVGLIRHAAAWAGTTPTTALGKELKAPKAALRSPLTEAPPAFRGLVLP